MEPTPPPPATGVPPTDTPFPAPLYSPRQVAAAAFLGSPIAGCWLLASNYAAFGHAVARRNALLWGAVSTAALLPISLALPDSFPTAALPVVYTGSLYQLATTLQGVAVSDHVRAGGRKHSSWWVAGIGLASCVIVGTIFIGVVLLLP